MNQIKNPLDFYSSFLKVFLSMWLAMMAAYYLSPFWPASWKKTASLPIKYLCSGSLGVDESYTPPMILSVAIAIVFIFVFVRWGKFEGKVPRRHANGSSIAGAAFLSASLCLFVTFIMIPCNSPSPQNGMGLAKFGYLFLSLSKLSFVMFSLFHSLLISYFYHSCVILIQSQRKWS